jgi:predicted dehydrogenase
VWVNETIFAPHIPATSATGGMFRHFAECVAAGRECIASGADNLKSFEMCLAAFKAAESHRAIALPLPQ